LVLPFYVERFWRCCSMVEHQSQNRLLWVQVMSPLKSYCFLEAWYCHFTLQILSS